MLHVDIISKERSLTTYCIQVLLCVNKRSYMCTHMNCRFCVFFYIQKNHCHYNACRNKFFKHIRATYSIFAGQGLTIYSLQPLAYLANVFKNSTAPSSFLVKLQQLKYVFSSSRYKKKWSCEKGKKISIILKKDIYL